MHNCAVPAGYSGLWLLEHEETVLLWKSVAKPFIYQPSAFSQMGMLRDVKHVFN